MAAPSFLRKTVLRNLRGLGQSHLLGLVHGHWDLPVSFSATEQAEAVNMGVSIIVPAKKILETLHNPELDALRKKHWKNDQPSPDSGFATLTKL